MQAACLPTPTLDNLLKAVLLRDERAVTAWNTWSSSVDIFEDTLKGGSYQLLPLLYRNLATLGVKDPRMGRLKGIVRNTWTRNQSLFNEALPVLPLLDKAGIRTLLLNRTALLVGTYADASTVLLDSFDVYVPPASVVDASTIVLKAGFTSIHDRHWRIAQTTGLRYVSKTGQKFNLHTNLPLHSEKRTSEYIDWERLVPVSYQGVNTCTLSPTQQIISLCFDGLYLNRRLAVDWIAHIAGILYAETNRIGWHHLIEMAQAQRLVLPLSRTLSYLAQSFSVPIPETQLQALENCMVSQVEQREWRFLSQTRTGFWNRYHRLRRLWFSILRMNNWR
jgi:hypothetical protein